MLSNRTRCNDDPEERPGLAHLLEHVVTRMASRKYFYSFHGQTIDDNTFYTFEAPIVDFTNIIRTWSEILFSSSIQLNAMPDIESIVKRELKRVDEEFYEKRNAGVNNFAKLQAILKTKEMVMPKFGWGNLTTLKKDHEDVDHVIGKLEELRVHYRHRPVFFCIYAPWPINLVGLVVESKNFYA